MDFNALRLSFFRLPDLVGRKNESLSALFLQSVRCLYIICIKNYTCQVLIGWTYEKYLFF